MHDMSLIIKDFPNCCGLDIYKKRKLYMCVTMFIGTLDQDLKERFFQS